MLLRRIKEHVNAQNWTALALDFFIVVAGILIAFQITQWNDARNMRAREHDILANLAVEFDDIVDEAQIAAERTETIVANLDTIIAALKGGVLFVSPWSNMCRQYTNMRNSVCRTYSPAAGLVAALAPGKSRTRDVLA